MMASLPSYEEAVSGGHWLDLAAPYMSIRCYSKLCRVSRRFHSQFSPRLWNDPLQVARHLGLHPNDDLRWLAYFITRHAKTVRRSTRKLVTSLDFRAFAVDTPVLVAGASGQSFTELLQQVGVLFPAARCILIGGKTSYDPVDLGRLLKPDAYPEDGSVPMPLLLDVSHCGLPLPNNFFHLSYWRQLVFLDMSHLPGSLKGIIKSGTFSRGALPNLRILKLRGRGLTEESFAPIAEFSKSRVWSLNLCQNKLTDASAHTLLPQCFGADDLTVDYGRSEVEGKLLNLKHNSGSELPPVWRGWLSYIQETPSSGAFSHPDRYLADAPVYDYEIGRQSRLAGHERLQSDSTEDIKIALAGGLGCPIPNWHDARDTDICKLPSSLTHLHLSGNPSFTAEGVETVFRRSRGHIRHFDCASPAIPTYHAQPRNSKPSLKVKQLKLAGILGRSHVFRPVFASNLQSLRIHHSLVTHIPTLLDADPARSPLTALQYAETVLRERAELAYPLNFVPDLNPRLQSLTLTRLPRVSSGPLIGSLIQLFISASDQETAIRHTAASLSRRSPTMLRGLRHIRLEFDPWPRRSDDHDAASALDSLDAGALLDSGADDFSFFKNPVASSSSSASTSTAVSAFAYSTPKQPAPRRDPAESSPAVTGQSNSSADATSQPARAQSGKQSVRLSHYPLPGAISADSEYVCEIVSLDDDGKRYSQTHSRAVDAYMANLAEPSLRTNIRPATPDQVKAGVPMGVCVYNLAWDAIVWLESGLTAFATTDNNNNNAKMKNVVDAIRQFRAKTKAEYTASVEVSRLLSQHGDNRRTSAPTHRHWMGKLELMF
ncbi:leucine rich repeat domain containing protein [Ophiostoma piceae UAMH 11346]|uniref:Leucine rich repeat domain containing protein n=1 Tax=Ophiostoma piceae (strain UAMH 11346) TaxID=1262450 RepID=S3C495_OPHP1|nr:leucine rich repeat domain containing protein [Ophiostoma piceae UAMH 11346]